MYINNYTFELLIAGTNGDKMKASRDYKMNACSTRTQMHHTNARAHSVGEGVTLGGGGVVEVDLVFESGVFRVRAILGGGGGGVTFGGLFWWGLEGFLGLKVVVVG